MASDIQQAFKLFREVAHQRFTDNCRVVAFDDSDSEVMRQRAPTAVGCNLLKQSERAGSKQRDSSRVADRPIPVNRLDRGLEPRDMLFG